MFKRKPLWLATATALGVASLGSMIANPVFAQDQDADEELLVEEVVVTGSRIKRTMDTQSQEIITFTAEDMNLAGDISVSDALRSSTMNSFGSFRESSGSSAQSNATLDLRGVGASRTMILMNGRRVVGSPSLGGGGTVNLNMIPFSAVDRVEVIADGASSVYGSDAIAGVVNIILKKNYTGMTVQARYGDRSQDDGEEGVHPLLLVLPAIAAALPLPLSMTSVVRFLTPTVTIPRPAGVTTTATARSLVGLKVLVFQPMATH